MKIAEVAIHVSFEDGQTAVFTLSANGGQLYPSLADGVGADADCWVKAADMLASNCGLGLPTPESQAKGVSGQTIWPWM